MDCRFFPCFHASLPFLKRIWLTFRRLKTHKSIECKYADTEKLLQIEKFPNLFEILGGNKFFWRWLSMSYLFLSRDFSSVLSRSGKALVGDVNLNVESRERRRLRAEKAAKNSSQVATQSRSWNVKWGWPHRYELIDFPCSLHSCDFADFLFVWLFSFNKSDNLHEKFRLENRCATRTPTVIRLTALFANNFARNWQRFIFVQHSKFPCHCQF